MTDTTSSKPMWTRCPGCKDRVFNDKLDIGIHRGHCPADLQRTLQNLKRQFEELKELVDGLDEQVSTEPTVDPDGVAPWTDDDDQHSQYLDDVTPARADAIAAFSTPEDDYFTTGPATA